MKKNLHPPVGRFLSLSLTLLFLIFIAVLVIIQNKNTSQVTLIANENEFKLNFDITNNDQSEFLKVLEKLGLPQSVAKGVEFELDATSSAKLTFATPVKANLNILPGKIAFKGKVNTSFLQDQEAKSIKIPTSTNLAVFSGNLIAFIKSRLILSQEFSAWLSKNLASDQGQYLVVFGPNSDFTLIFKNPNIYFSSSYEAAQELINTLKSQTPSLDFPPKDTPLASLIILFKNNDQNTGDVFTNFILSGSNNYSRSINQVRELDFILRSSEFSGLINLK